MGHSAGNVTGLTLLDFLALPPKVRVRVSPSPNPNPSLNPSPSPSPSPNQAKVSCTFQGEDGGEGFLSLRKM